MHLREWRDPARGTEGSNPSPSSGESRANLIVDQGVDVPSLSGQDMTCWPVSPRVANVKNNDPSLIEPVIHGFPAMIVTA